MPKLKNRKSAAKRVKSITSNGKVMVRSRSNQHLAARKSKRTMAGSGNSKVLTDQQAKNMKALLPYSM